MFKLGKQAFANFLVLMRRAGGGRLPSIFARFPNRTRKLLPPTVRGTLPGGVAIDFDLLDRMQLDLFLYGGYYELQDIELVTAACARPSTMFFDIGANVGVYTFHAATHVPELPVFAFEPNPRTFAKLSETKKLGSFPKVELVEAALSDGNGKAKLLASNVNSGWSSLGQERGLENASAIEVPLIRFDDWWREHMYRLPTVEQFVIKIDIEGYETRALRGMKEFVSQRPVALLLVEFFATALAGAGSSPDELFKLLQELGFRGYRDRALTDEISVAPEAASPTNLYFTRL